MQYAFTRKPRKHGRDLHKSTSHDRLLAEASARNPSTVFDSNLNRLCVLRPVRMCGNLPDHAPLYGANPWVAAFITFTFTGYTVSHLPRLALQCLLHPPRPVFSIWRSAQINKLSTRRTTSPSMHTRTLDCSHWRPKFFLGRSVKGTANPVDYTTRARQHETFWGEAPTVNPPTSEIGRFKTRL